MEFLKKPSIWEGSRHGSLVRSALGYRHCASSWLPRMTFAVINGFDVNCFSPSGWMSINSDKLLTGIREAYPVNVSSSDDDDSWRQRFFYFWKPCFILIGSASPLLAHYGAPTRAMSYLRMTSRMASRLWGCNPFIHLEERSSTSVWELSVFWQFATFWWGAIILLKKGMIYLVEEMWWNDLDSTPH